ncbi:MAG: class I SAM-dependent methyltransferase [bacterium]|nr:class I SAM-dependent methyltransferase [bacterium]
MVSDKQISPNSKRQERQLQVARKLFAEIGEQLDVDLCVKLWDGSIVPLGEDVTSDLMIIIKHPGVITSLMRRPRLDVIIRHFIKGMIDFEGGTLLDVGVRLAFKHTRGRLKKIPRRDIFNFAKAFMFAPTLKPGESRSFGGDQTGKPQTRTKQSDKAFIEFHYDLSNEFYELFLGEHMVYTCAYFTDWENTLDKAQLDKLDMICRKLRLVQGERFLDIGCGWGGLICHAAKHYGVKAHGVTLSSEQYDYAVKKITNMGLQDLVTIELKDYRALDEKFDKIASIGMAEAIGVANTDEYFATVNRLLVDKGLFLNHAIARKAKKKNNTFSSRPEQRALQKYIFPGGELDDLGHTIAALEQHKFEIMDVEGWREHYQLTTQLWCDRLTQNKEQAVALVGEETYRIWVAYLGGASLAFLRGSARLYQTLVSKNPKGPTKLPPSRHDLYK